MKIKEVLNELSKQGNTIATIAKEKVKIGEKRLKAALHNAGYKYRNSAPKGWYYAGEGEEPSYQSIYDFIEVNNSSPNVKRTSPNVKKNSPVNSQPVALDVKEARNEGEQPIHTVFTHEEITILKQLIRSYVLDEKPSGSQDDNSGDTQGDRDNLYQRVISLEKGDKVRKTIVINKEVGALLDTFADQQKFNKSDLLEIAILDLVKKYQ